MPVYEVPRAFFPADSRLVNDYAHSAVESLPCLARLRAALAVLGADLQRQLTSPMELWRRAGQVSQLMRRAGAALAQTFPSSPAIDSSQRLGMIALEGENADRLLGYRIYDDYFHVTRIKDMTAPEVLAQAVETSELILRDLPFTLLGLDEIIAFIEADYCLLGCFLDEPSGAAADLPEEEADEDDPWKQFWLANGRPPAVDHDVPTFRWIVGHHFFDLCAMGCQSELRKASLAADNGSPAAVVARAIDTAGTFLRGTTAAMWYAANYSSSLYKADIRKQMISTRSPHGFSGTQNADYERFKSMKTEFVKLLTSKYGDRASGWKEELDPEAQILKAFLRFKEIEIEDNEHHVLIAALRVGSEPSLLQAHAREELERDFGAEALEDMPRVNALEMLRTMAHSKREELESFLS